MLHSLAPTTIRKLVMEWHSFTLSSAKLSTFGELLTQSAIHQVSHAGHLTLCDGTFFAQLVRIAEIISIILPLVTCEGYKVPLGHNLYILL